MTSAEIDALRAAIDAAVPPLGGPPKVQGPALNAVLRRLNDGLASPLPPAQLAALAAAAAPSAENAYATRADLAPLAAAIAEATATATTTSAGAAYPAAVASPGQAPRPYATIFEAVAAAQSGEALHLCQPLAAPVGPTTEAVIDLGPDVAAYLHGHDISSPDTQHDIITFRGGRNVLYGGHATISQRDTGGGAGSWFIGTYGGPTIDATIHDLHLRLDTYKSVGFALFAGGTYAYRGTVRSLGRYVLRMSPGANNQLFTGEGSIWQQGGTLFWLQTATARAEWRGDITALDNALFNLEAGTVVLRQGYLHADVRPAGAELVVQGGPASTLILENYTFGGVPGATVGHVGTLVLRGNSVVIGNLLADKVIDERPLAPAAAVPAPAAPAAFTLPNAVPARVAQFAPAATRTVAAYEVTQDGGATWAPATGPTLPVPAAGLAAGQLAVRVAATPEGAPASAPTYLPATGPVRTVVGLRARYYAGCFGDDPTFFRTRTPLFEETLAHAGRFRDPVFDNFGRVYGPLDQFSVLYDGQLLITESGTYSFNYSADDRGGIWLDDAVQDPRNDNRADHRSLYLEAGLHPILLAYGEYGGAQNVDYYWSGPGVDDILNAGRLRLFTNEPLAPDPHPAPSGLLPDADFDQPLSPATWAPARGWDVVDGTLLGTDTDFTTTTFELPPPGFAPVAYTLEVSVDLAPGAQLHVGLAGFEPAETKLTTSGVHRLALTPAGGGGKGSQGQVQLRAEASQLVRVHYAQLLTANVAPGSSTFVEDSDPRCAYTGAWQSEANEETIYRDNEGKYVSPGQDAAVRLSFSGTQVRIWACTSASPNDGYTTRARIFIDDEEQPAASQQVANPSGDLPRSWAWYTSPLLPAGPHTIHLQADPSTGQYLVFDGFEVVGEGDLEYDTEVDPGPSAQL